MKKPIFILCNFILLIIFIFILIKLIDSENNRLEYANLKYNNDTNHIEKIITDTYPSLTAKHDINK